MDHLEMDLRRGAEGSREMNMRDDYDLSQGPWGADRVGVGWM